MIENVISIGPNASVKDVMEIFVAKKIGGLPICESDGTLLGVVSDGDIIRTIKPIDRKIYDFLFFMEYVEERDLQRRLDDLAETSIIQIAKKKGIVTVFQDDTIESVVTKLSKHHFKKLPVIDDNNRVVGIISRGDVLRKIQASILKKL